MQAFLSRGGSKEQQSQILPGVPEAPNIVAGYIFRYTPSVSLCSIVDTL